MKNLILILVAILTSLTATTQVRFNYVRWLELDDKDDSTGIVYFTTDPDTIISNTKDVAACIVYEFDNEGETSHYIPIYKVKLKKEKTIYYGKWKKDLFKIVYNKEYGDFQVIERALVPRYRTTIYFHRDYDYYEQLSDTGE